MSALAIVAMGMPVVVAPSASADVCGSVGGPNADVAGCLPPGTLAEGATVLGSVAVADAVDEWHQRLRGQPPCFTPQGVPYYTPGTMPCA
ncbi:MAG: hypothetical protein ACOYBX_04625 [Mycobacterium sp.]|jgi:hypothetical protein